MSGDGKPKPLNLPQADTNPPAGMSRPKPLGIPDAAPASDAAPTPRVLPLPPFTAAVPPPPEPPKPRGLNLPERSAPPAPPPAAPVQPRSLNLAERTAPPPNPTPAPRPAVHRPGGLPQQNPLVDQLVAKAQQIEPTLQPGRVKGRIDTLLSSNLTEVLDFGARNLAPLQATSNEKAKIASEIARIDAIGWIGRTKDASCKPPSFMDRLKGVTATPAYYEGMLQKTRAEVLAFVAKLEGMKKTFFREIADLHLDAIAMIVCKDVMPDDQAKITCDNRGRTLLMAHQQAAMLQATIEQSLALCMDQVGQIDHLMSVTLPAWKTAFGAR